MKSPHKEKIAITLSQDILSRLDEMVDGGRMRNRSHAVESLLVQAMGTRVEKALICAGEIVDIAGKKVPAALLPFEGSPVIEHQVKLLGGAGVREIIIVVRKSDEAIRKLIGSGEKFGVRISYVEQEDKTIGSAYALKLARKKLEGAYPFLVLYGDVFAEIDLRDFVAYHKEGGNAVTIALTSIEDPSLYGSVTVKGEKITAFTEKPKLSSSVSRVINAGIFCVEPNAMQKLAADSSSVLEKDVFPVLAQQGLLGGYLFEGMWCNVRNQARYPRFSKKK